MAIVEGGVLVVAIGADGEAGVVGVEEEDSALGEGYVGVAGQAGGGVGCGAGSAGELAVGGPLEGGALVDEVAGGGESRKGDLGAGGERGGQDVLNRQR